MMTANGKKVEILKALLDLATVKGQQVISPPVEKFVWTIEEFYTNNQNLIGQPYDVKDLIDALRSIMDNDINEQTAINFTHLNTDRINTAIKVYEQLF